jgi:hypothetical protein
MRIIWIRAKAAAIENRVVRLNFEASPKIIAVRRFHQFILPLSIIPKGVLSYTVKPGFELFAGSGLAVYGGPRNVSS